MQRRLLRQKSFAILVLAMIFLLSAFASGEDINLECGSLSPGELKKAGATYSLKSKGILKIAIAVEMKRLPDGERAQCDVRWTVFQESQEQKRTELFHFSKRPEEDLAGTDAPSTSPDGSKLLVPFWTAEGDYTNHLPAVYDFRTKEFYVREIADRITRDLPSCDYFTMVGDIRNSGDVSLYVPKSTYVEEGCPDQGKWLLHPATNNITRIRKTHAQSPKKSER